MIMLRWKKNFSCKKIFYYIYYLYGQFFSGYLLFSIVWYEFYVAATNAFVQCPANAIYI